MIQAEPATLYRVLKDWLLNRTRELASLGTQTASLSRPGMTHERSRLAWSNATTKSWIGRPEQRCAVFAEFGSILHPRRGALGVYRESRPAPPRTGR